jgi:hypothetical protein
LKRTRKPNLLKRDKAAQMVRLMLEGLSIRAIQRLTGLSRNTVCSYMRRCGAAAIACQDELLRDLPIQSLQVDDRVTPAMELGIASTMWSFDEFFDRCMRTDIDERAVLSSRFFQDTTLKQQGLVFRRFPDHGRDNPYRISRDWTNAQSRRTA